jgi:hypothetical protein
VKPSQHPNLPVMLGGVAKAMPMADKLLERGITAPPPSPSSVRNWPWSGSDRNRQSLTRQRGALVASLARRALTLSPRYAYFTRTGGSRRRS